MKIVFDTKTKNVKVGSKVFGENMPNDTELEVINQMRQFIHDKSELTMEEQDSMWMSYRYCIGRHSIASHQRAGDIAQNYYGRMSDERSIFTAYDINKSIEDVMRFGNGPEWHFPITSYNRIYTSAIDIYCKFIEDYNIKSKEDYLKYYSIDVILSDNEDGYKIETTTWEEVLTKNMPLFKENYNDIETVDDLITLIKKLKSERNTNINENIRWIINSYPSEEWFFFHHIDDLFVWNNLCHLFDIEHHHKSILVNGEECTWYWTYVRDTEQREDGCYYIKEVGYKKIRVPITARIGCVTTYIPDESIKKDLY